MNQEEIERKILNDKKEIMVPKGELSNMDIYPDVCFIAYKEADIQDALQVLTEFILYGYWTTEKDIVNCVKRVFKDVQFESNKQV